MGEAAHSPRSAARTSKATPAAITEQEEEEEAAAAECRITALVTSRVIMAGREVTSIEEQEQERRAERMSISISHNTRLREAWSFMEGGRRSGE
jgi:hypothetical protein